MPQPSQKLPESFDAGNRLRRGEEWNYLVEMIHSRKEESAQAGAGAAAAPVQLFGLEKAAIVLQNPSRWAKSSRVFRVGRAKGDTKPMAHSKGGQVE